MRPVRSLTVVAALAAATALPTVPTVPTVPAVAAAAAACGADAAGGVTVVVDPGPLGGAVTWACVEGGDGQTAAELTESAGHELEYVQGTPFVCRLGGRPGSDQESCGRTPPADAYWGLFWAEDRDAAWVYSTLGVSALTVPEGGVVGWRWQDGGDRDDPPALAGEAMPGADPTGEEPVVEEPVDEEPVDGAPGEAVAPVWAVGGVVLLLVTALGLAARRRRANR